MPLLSSRSSGSKRAYWLVPLVFVGAFVAFAKVMNTNPPTNRVETSPDTPQLKTRLYEITPEEAAKKITALPLSTYGRSWKAVEENHISKDEIQLVFQVPVIVFTDILTVSLKRRDGETTQVNVESHSQIGQGDFGENRRHVLQILGALDSKFS